MAPKSTLRPSRILPISFPIPPPNRLTKSAEFLDKIITYILPHSVGLPRSPAPQGVFFLVGPTGTGKSYAAELLSNYIHHKPLVMTINCGEYTNSHDVAKLIGAPPGYLGFNEDNARLSVSRLNLVRSSRSQLAIILFDEIEKAAASLQDIVLSILDRGNICLGNGSQVSFENTIIFFTSNFGSLSVIEKETGRWSLGNTININSSEEMISYTSLSKQFSSEFLNRIDEIFIYNTLTRLELRNIAEYHIALIQEKLHTNLGPRAPELLINEEFYETILPNEKDRIRYGARGIIRNIYSKIVIPLAKFLQENPETHKTVTFTIINNQTRII